MAWNYCGPFEIDPSTYVYRNRFNVNQTCTDETNSKYGCDKMS